MFDSDQVHYETIEVPEKKEEPSAFSIDDLMYTHTAALFIKAGINDDFDKGRYSVHWKKMLKKERKRLRDALYSDEANRVQDKIAEINSYNRIDSNTHKKQTEAITNNDACSDADTKPANTKNSTVGKRTRKDNLRRAIEAAIKTFGKKPSFDELWKFFQDDKDKTGFIEDYADDKITWVTTKGKLRDEPIANIRNRLSRVNS